MNKMIKGLAALAMAATLAACSSNSSTAASSKSSASSSSSETSSETSSAAVATDGKYTVTNNTGAKVTGLYFYKTGDTDKGQNYAEDGLEDGSSTEVDIHVDEDQAKDYAMTVEYTTEDGKSVTVFDSLHLEEAPLYLKPASDVDSGATPFSAPEN